MDQSLAGARAVVRVERDPKKLIAFSMRRALPAFSRSVKEKARDPGRRDRAALQNRKVRFDVDTTAARSLGYG